MGSVELLFLSLNNCGLNSQKKPVKGHVEDLGRSWTVLDGLGRSWKVLDGLGRSWTVLDGLGSWTILDGLGRS